VKGREAVDLEIVIFFLARGISFSIACSTFFEQIVCAGKALGYEKL
jgi:hypothetical protein